MVFMKKFVLLGFLWFVFVLVYVECMVFFVGFFNGNQWFIIMVFVLNDGGLQVVCLCVDFLKVCLFFCFYQVKLVFLFVCFLCSKEIIEIDSINLQGEFGYEIVQVVVVEFLLGVVQYLLCLIVELVFSYVCMKLDFIS